MRAPDVVTSTDCASRSGGNGKKGSSGIVGAMVTDPAPSLQRACNSSAWNPIYDMMIDPIYDDRPTSRRNLVSH